jgi:hypothetical protein
MLVGKFVIVDNGESYRTAKIVEDVGGGYFMVSFDNMQNPDSIPPRPMELNSLDQMAGNGVQGTWEFFDTEEDRRRWLDWMDSPSTPKVVKLIKG